MKTIEHSGDVEHVYQQLNMYMKFPQRVKGKTNEEIRAKNLPELKIITTQAN